MRNEVQKTKYISCSERQTKTEKVEKAKQVR